MVHRPRLWEEVQQVVAEVDADLFVKHMSCYVSDIIDVGIEILPMKELESEMSSGVPYYERDLLNMLRQGTWPPGSSARAGRDYAVARLPRPKRSTRQRPGRPFAKISR